MKVICRTKDALSRSAAVENLAFDFQTIAE
jgi:hypothetical protein